MNHDRVNHARRTLLRQGSLLVGAASLVSLGLWSAGTRSVAGSAQVMPPPAVDAPTAASGSALQVAVLAGGCFWGVQGVYQHLNGVTKAVSGYAGGDKNAANYKAVTTGRTGHAELVEITFDPSQISYGRLLQIFFSVVHDPTQLNRQGPDVGTHYRSAIFPRSAEQAQIAKSYIAQLNQAADLQRCNRHQDRSRSGVLRGRGLSSGLHDQESTAVVHRHARLAEGRGSETPVPGALSQRSGPGGERALKLTVDRRSLTAPTQAAPPACCLPPGLTSLGSVSRRCHGTALAWNWVKQITFCSH